MTTSSKSPRTDLRVVKTRRSIHAAFRKLLKKMDYSQVTVSAIAREAQINRNTFYAHYDSVETLLEEICRSKIEAAWNEAFAHIDQDSKGGAATASGCSVYNENNDSYGIRVLTLAFMKALDEDFELEANLLRGVDLFKLSDILMTPFAEFVEAERLERGLTSDKIPRSIIACYIGSVINAYVDWRFRSPHEPIEDLANQVASLFVYSIVRTLNEE